MAVGPAHTHRWAILTRDSWNDDRSNNSGKLDNINVIVMGKSIWSNEFIRVAVEINYTVN